MNYLEINYELFRDKNTEKNCKFKPEEQVSLIFLKSAGWSWTKEHPIVIQLLQ